MTINASIDGRTLEAFGKLLEARKTYLKEASSNALTGSAIDILISLRARTRVARLASIKPQPKLDNSLKIAFRGRGNSKKYPVLQRGGARYVKASSDRIIYHDVTKDAKVYKWIYQRGEDKTPIIYYVTALSTSDAKKVMKDRLSRRLQTYRGLAKRALGVLMHKTSSSAKSVVDQVNSLCDTVAQNETKVKETVSGLQHRLVLDDDLNYAIKALYNGNASVL